MAHVGTGIEGFEGDPIAPGCLLLGAAEMLQRRAMQYNSHCMNPPANQVPDLVTCSAYDGRLILDAANITWNKRA